MPAFHTETHVSTAAGLWIQQGALPWLGKERDEIVCCLWIGEFVHGSTTIVANNVGSVCLKFANTVKNGEKRRNQLEYHPESSAILNFSVSKLPTHGNIAVSKN